MNNSKQFLKFHTVRHGDMRSINAEYNIIKSKIKEIKYFPYPDHQPRSDIWLKNHNLFQHLKTLEHRFEELSKIKKKKKSLAKQFVPHYYYRPDFIWNRTEHKYISTGDGLLIKVKSSSERWILSGAEEPINTDNMLATCSVCEKEKELSDFYKHKNTKNGRSSQCKTCNYIACVTSRKRKAKQKKEEK